MQRVLLIIISVLVLTHVGEAETQKLGVSVSCKSVKWIEVLDNHEITEYCQCCKNYKQILHVRKIKNWSDWLQG